jgi:hypothetical protein
VSHSNLVSGLLEFGVFTLLEVIIQFFRITAVLDAEVNDLFCCLCISKIEGRSRIEFDVLRLEIEVFACWELLAVDVEELDGKAARLGDAVLNLSEG